MTDRFPLNLYVELDPQHIEGQRRARIVASVKTPDDVTLSETTLFSEVVYDYPEEHRGAERNVMLLFTSALERVIREASYS